MTKLTQENFTLIDLTADPFRLFETWFQEAQKTEPNDPNAMVLTTATPDGYPSSRVILLKGVDHCGFVFYTNLESRKGKELSQNPHVALLFYWKSLRRQIRIEGDISPVSTEEADAYFASRSRLSRLGAIASDQSRPLADRAIFEERLRSVEQRYPSDSIPRPENWSGYRVCPVRFEFWQERPYRLHDRAVWHKNDSTPDSLRHDTLHESWHVTRLYP
ncbi:MAG: pyridoxamine 5'-phosphate oxidase [Acetobacter sp.]|nr:pyridoxamine 5'-phosphate oxidase [Acetobacter sp.]